MTERKEEKGGKKHILYINSRKRVGKCEKGRMKEERNTGRKREDKKWGNSDRNEKRKTGKLKKGESGKRKDRNCEKEKRMAEGKIEQEA